MTEMTGLTHTLFKALDIRMVRYCHWKSNINLSEAVAGKTDLDLLIDEKDAQKFLSLVHDLGFKKACQPDETTSIAHYFGLDPDSGCFVHLHVYFKIVTGGSLLKNYCLPLEDMLFDGAEKRLGVMTPTKGAELALYVIRKTVEHASIAEAILLIREGTIEKELDWLLSDGVKEAAAALLARWLPSVDRDTFIKSLDSLNKGLPSRYIAARRMKARLADYAINGPAKAFYLRNAKLLKTIFRKFISRRKQLTPSAGGARIAVVGADATGKSTVHAEISRWLGEHFWVERVHTGKPPATPLTLIPNVIIPLLRRVAPRYRSLEIEGDLREGFKAEGERAPAGGFRLFVFVMRSLMVAYDRRALLKKVCRMSAQGAIVVCDRYPSHVTGAMDSSVMDASDAGKGSWAAKAVLKLENRIYKRIPAPDIVISLHVPVETALKRNVLRNKKGSEDDDYIIKRHAQSRRQEYIAPLVVKIDTSRALDETLLQIKKAIWAAL